MNDETTTGSEPGLFFGRGSRGASRVSSYGGASVSGSPHAGSLSTSHVGVTGRASDVAASPDAAAHIDRTPTKRDRPGNWLLWRKCKDHLEAACDADDPLDCANEVFDFTETLGVLWASRQHEDRVFAMTVNALQLAATRLDRDNPDINQMEALRKGVAVVLAKPPPTPIQLKELSRILDDADLDITANACD